MVKLLQLYGMSPPIAIWYKPTEGIWSGEATHGRGRTEQIFHVKTHHSDLGLCVSTSADLIVELLAKTSWE